MWLYFALILGIVLVPGMDMLLVLGSALAGGRRAGLAATAGIMLGGVVHSAVGTASVSILIKVAPALFVAMIVIGSLYMAWLGVNLLRSTGAVGLVQPGSTRSPATSLRQGVVTSLLNPKAYVFVVAVFPQVLKPEYGSIWLQGVVVCLITVLTQLAVYGLVAIFADRGRDFLGRNPTLNLIVGRVVGGIFIVTAVVALWHAVAS